MKAAVIVFPGSNCDRDVALSLERATGHPAGMVWHGETEVPETDLIVLPGGFSYGDYLRCGAIAAQSPIMRDVIAKAEAGTPVLGVCNGFQMLTECGLLPGVLMQNASLRYVCRDVHLKVARTDLCFTSRYAKDQVIRIPIAHHEGNYFADDETLDRLEQDERVVFRYCAADGGHNVDSNPNGAARDIAGIVNEAGNVLGMMPHPERLDDEDLGGTDGTPMFRGLAEMLQ